MWSETSLHISHIQPSVVIRHSFFCKCSTVCYQCFLVWILRDPCNAFCSKFVSLCISVGKLILLFSKTLPDCAFVLRFDLLKDPWPTLFCLCFFRLTTAAFRTATSKCLCFQIWYFYSKLCMSISCYGHYLLIQKMYSIFPISMMYSAIHLLIARYVQLRKQLIPLQLHIGTDSFCYQRNYQ